MISLLIVAALGMMLPPFAEQIKQINGNEKSKDEINSQPNEASVNYVETENEYELSGRWFEKEINGIKMQVTLNDGAMIYFKIKGTDSVVVNFEVISEQEVPYFAYVIDGMEPIRQPITNGKILLPDKGEHVVWLVIDGMNEWEDKWNEEKGVAFKGLESSGVIKGIQPTTARILFIGDSISIGVKALSDNSISNYNSATNSFAWYVSKKLNVEPYFVAYGATGILATGSFQTTSVMLDSYSANRPAELPACDLIVVNCGTNDSDAPNDLFYKGYQELLLKLHERYPENIILCIVPLTQTHVEEIRQVALPFIWCNVVETKDWEITYTDNVHPDVNGAKKMADYLEQFIRAKVWKME